jgi:hypothetical protein
MCIYRSCMLKRGVLTSLELLVLQDPALRKAREVYFFLTFILQSVNNFKTDKNYYHSLLIFMIQLKGFHVLIFIPV